MSAQDSIPFQRMYPDGICRVSDNYYTKTIRFSDINYQLNTNEDKSAIFDGWCDFLNYFDSSIRLQLSFINRAAKSQIEERMKLAGTVNLSAYLRKLALDGYILHLDLPEIQDMVRLLRQAGNNINQITRRLHGTGRIYEEDIGYLSEKQNEIWEGVNTILTRLAQLK